MKLAIDALQAFGFDPVEFNAPLPNGHHFPARCFGCQTDFLTTKRPVADRRDWCQDCRAVGKPATQRARDLRERKRISQ